VLPRKKLARKVLTAKNAARANARRHREELEQNPLYEHDVVHSSENVIRVGLSTSSVYPMTVSECFSTAARLGYDGVEVMVTNNTETQDGDLMRDLVQETGLPVMSLHAPTLLFMPRVLDRDHWQKLRLTCDLAEEVGARTVVLHPPFRWQGEYANNFAAGVKAISEETGITLAVENMYPWRAGIREVLVYLPHWNPIGQGYDAVTFDFSHASTAGMNAVDTVTELFDVLQHIHLTDGSGSLQDEHLVPGRGLMPVAETLQHLAKHNWEGDVVVEVNTRFVAKKSTRDEMLVESLEFARRHLGLEDL
jgi:sugar phosphate isomerase/epimerase